MLTYGFWVVALWFFGFVCGVAWSFVRMDRCVEDLKRWTSAMAGGMEMRLEQKVRTSCGWSRRAVNLPAEIEEE